MGIVYKARQIALGRLVALKLIRSAEFASMAELIRFQNEAEAVAHLDHPHIVPIYEVGQPHGQRFFSMKLVQGEQPGPAAWRLRGRLPRSGPAGRDHRRSHPSRPPARYLAPRPQAGQHPARRAGQRPMSPTSAWPGGSRRTAN